MGRLIRCSNVAFATDYGNDHSFVTHHQFLYVAEIVKVAVAE